MFKRLGLSNKKGLTRLIISFCQAEHYCTSEDNLTIRFANPRVLGLKNQNNDLHGKAKGKQVKFCKDTNLNVSKANVSCPDRYRNIEHIVV